MSKQAERLTDEGVGVPTPYGFDHISIPTRDLALSKQFFIEVLGGTLTAEGAGSAQVEFGNFKIILAPQATGSTPPDAEYPHYAFTVGPDDFLGVKQRLEAYGVPTHDPWGRKNRPHALMYFRDPSGNEFEMFCPAGFTAMPLKLGSRAGGDYTINFSELCYRNLKAPAAKDKLPRVRPQGFNHMTLPVRDMHEGKRFWLTTLGGKVLLDLPDHITVVVGGAEVGMATTDHGWTAKDAEYPHYTFLVKSEDMAAQIESLQSYGVPTSEIWTRNGSDACLYFRDPSGNLWELYCERGFKGATRRGASAGGDYRPDVKALNYEAWKDPGQ